MVCECCNAIGGSTDRRKRLHNWPQALQHAPNLRQRWKVVNDLVIAVVTPALQTPSIDPSSRWTIELRAAPPRTTATYQHCSV
jgi:hypothetical protein